MGVLRVDVKDGEDGSRRYAFETVADRDRWLELQYPERTCLEDVDVPGVYSTPSGDVVQVFLETITVWTG